jgi:hypothetical protein
MNPAGNGSGPSPNSLMGGTVQVGPDTVYHLWKEHNALEGTGMIPEKEKKRGRAGDQRKSMRPPLLRSAAGATCRGVAVWAAGVAAGFAVVMVWPWV